MRRFRFRLETALRLRHLAETNALAALADADRALAAAEKALSAALDERERHRDYCARLVAERAADVDLLRAATRYGEVLDEAVDAEREALRGAVAEREARFDTVLERRREREALERLRRQRLSEHLLAEAAAEQAALDEAAVLRFGRG